MARTDTESFIAKSNAGRFASRLMSTYRLLIVLLIISGASFQGLSINLSAYACDKNPEQRSAHLLDLAPDARKSTSFNTNVLPSIAATKEEKLIQEVSQRLLAAADVRANKYIKRYAWPPTFQFVDSNVLNAYASTAYRQKAGPVKCPIDGKAVCNNHILRTGRDDEGNILILPIERRTNKVFPHVVVCKQLMTDLVEGDEDRLAFILGHELTHILLGHVLSTSLARRAKTPALKTIFTAEQEHDADVQGMKLALSAGYSIQGARELWLELSSDEFLKKHLGFNYTSFEGTGFDHPAWADRLKLIDENKQSLWKAMSAFENGAFFAQVQQYAAAEACFERVVKEFPESYEVWCNLGYARLMLYFDAFDRDDLAKFDLGQIEVGSFYVRPDTLRQQVRGINKRQWENSVEALEKALKLKPDLALAKANLALAYLMSPTGKNTAKASQYIEDAITLSKLDKDITALNRATLFNNSAVIFMADMKLDKANFRLKAAQAIKHIPAIDYNCALLLARSTDPADRHNALSLMEHYLSNISPASIWWDLGYGHYAGLSKEMGLNAKSKIELKQSAEAMYELRPLTSIETKQGSLITVSDPIDVVNSKIGSAVPVPVVVGTNLVKLSYPRHGIELLVTKRVLAIMLRRTDSPPIQLRAYGMGSAISLLRVGMPAPEIRSLLGYGEQITLSDPSVDYEFYPHVGIAVRYKRNKVSELVLTEIVVKKP